MRKLICLTLAAAAVLGAAPAFADEGASPRACFFSNQWRGWSAPTPDTLLIRVGLTDVYRVELAPGARVRDNNGDFLVNRLVGSNTICSALDLNLYLSDDLGFKRPLIARSLTKLTPEEVAAIPREHLP
jgi:hypothetical protein